MTTTGEKILAALQDSECFESITELARKIGEEFTPVRRTLMFLEQVEIIDSCADGRMKQPRLKK